jgi:hypothetical protein
MEPSSRGSCPLAPWCWFASLVLITAPPPGARRGGRVGLPFQRPRPHPRTIDDRPGLPSISVEPSHVGTNATRREHLNVLRILGTMKAAGVPSSYVHVRRHTIRRFRGANRAARTIFGSRLFRRSTTRATHTHGWSNLELRLIPSRGRPCCVHNYGQTCCQIGLAAMIDRASRASG